MISSSSRSLRLEFQALILSFGPRMPTRGCLGNIAKGQIHNA